MARMLCLGGVVRLLLTRIGVVGGRSRSAEIRTVGSTVGGRTIRERAVRGTTSPGLGRRDRSTPFAGY